MFQIVSAGGDMLRKGYASFSEAESARVVTGAWNSKFNFATVEQVGA